MEDVRPSGRVVGTVHGRRPIRVLLVSEAAHEGDVLRALRRAGFAPQHRRVTCPDDLREAVADAEWDVVVADDETRGLDLLSALAVVREARVDVPLIAISGTGGEEHAVQAMRAGADDYLSKAGASRLALVLERVLADAGERRARRDAERAVREREQQALLELATAYEATVEGWSSALDLRDHETEGHSRRVTELTVRLARKMGRSESEIVHIRRGALLHDIGKIGVPDGILRKPGALTPEEWAIMRTHPTLAYRLLAPIEYLRPALDIPYCHHEKWDGTGYPRGLAGEDIPLSARMFAAVDIWDALRSARPYRQAWSAERTRAHIASLAGSHLDPAVVAAFLELVAAVTDADAAQAADGAAAMSRAAGRILVVDDYVANVKLLKRWLAGEGYDVVTASTGREALEAASLHHPDLVLLDIMIPEPDGLTVCRALKATPATAMMPVIFMSGLEPDGRTDARQLADDYIAKPIDVYELRARVRQTLERQRGSPGV